MRIAFVAATIIVSAFPALAVAETPRPDFCRDVATGSYTPFGAPPEMDAVSLCQYFETSQDIEQTILKGETGGPAPATGDPLTLEQTATNVVNFVDVDQDFKVVAQQFSGTQTIGNSIVAGALGALTNISQTGTNTANTVQGTTIELAIQIMGPGAAQVVNNSADTGGNLGNIVQDGSNIANLAVADHAIGVGIQDFRHDSSQHVGNYLDLEADSSISGRIEQSGTNIGNVLIAERVDSVIRRFDGTQTIDNTVILNDGHRPHIAQNGNNIANFISANSVGTVKQISTGTQTVNNIVRDAEGNEIRHANFEQSESNYLGASNVVNLMIVASPSGGSNGGEDMNITQEADFDQTAEGSNSQPQSGNVLVISR